MGVRRPEYVGNPVAGPVLGITEDRHVSIIPNYPSCRNRPAVADPREARLQLCTLLDANSPVLEGILLRAAAPGEGRLRHLIANTLRTRPDQCRLVPHLERWLGTETDEFARGAIAAALQGADRTPRKAKAPVDPPDLVETYRYVAGRLCHRVRNALPEPSTHLRRLRAAIADIPDGSRRSDLLALADGLRLALRRLSRIVEFDDDDEHFRWRLIALCEWLEAMNVAYASAYDSVQLTIDAPPDAHRLCIRATDFLLETVFWNLWKNAQQAVDGPCHVTVRIAVTSGHVKLLLLDNGEGFPAESRDLAFQDRFSTHGPARGRGLLEVADAVGRLLGTAKLVQERPGRLRVQLTFPLEAQ